MKKFVQKHLHKSDGGTANPETSKSNETTAAVAPANHGPGAGSQHVLAAADAGTLNIALQNQTSSNTVYAYITGLAINNNNAPVLLQSDGKTLYYPQSPSQPTTPLAADCSIKLGAPGSTTTVNIPKIAGGRIWFSVDEPLTFYINPGPAIVEPSVTNSSDPNINLHWAFCEFTYNDSQLFANISYVDFVSIPIALTLTNTSGGSQHVSGMNADGLTTVCNGLRSQAASDKQPWDQLIYNNDGQTIRALSPNNLLVSNANAFQSYWEPYIQQVWAKFAAEDLSINTQASFGNLSGRVTNNELQLGTAGSFAQPSAQDIFTCSTGPFATGSNTARNAVIPRLAAAFNRTTLLLSDTIPDGVNESQYYTNAVTNHYARIVHAANVDGRGYAFPYDDVVPDGGKDQAGTIMDGAPQLFTVAVGGNGAHA